MIGVFTVVNEGQHESHDSCEQQPDVDPSPVNEMFAKH